MDDPTLLRAYRDDGSEDAFRELVRRHLPVVHGAALRQVNGDAHLAQDVAQRVFIALARKAGRLMRQQSIVGWLYTAARFEAARVVRTELRRRRREEQAMVMNSPEPDEPSFAHLAPILDATMSELGHGDREAILLRYFSGQSFAEIGRTLQVSEEAARKRVDRALDRLRDSLRRRGFASTSAALAGALATHAAPAVVPATAAAVSAGACAELAAGSALSLSLLMSSTKLVTLIAGAVIAAGAWYWHDHLAWQRANENYAGLRAELAAAELRQKQQSSELATLNRALAEAETASAAVPAARAAAATGAPAYLTDARYRELARASSQARRHLEFQRLYRQLRLTPGQIEAFEGIMARQDEAQLDAALARAGGGNEQTVYRRSGAEWNAGMRQLLGEEGMKQLQDYLRSMPVRAFIDHFAVQSSLLGAALTPEQSDQLAALALANDVMYRQGKGTDPGTVNWNGVWDPATTLLTADQIALLQRTVEVWSLQKQLALQLKKGTPRS